MIPLRDEYPTRITPIVTIAIIIANVAVFFWQLSIGLDRSVYHLGLIPVELSQGVDILYRGRALGAGVEVQNLNPAWITVFSSMFSHGGWMHIIGNMWFLWIFGNNVEEAMGHIKYAIFYLVAGIAAAAAQFALGPEAPIPMVGASGAIGGVLGAFLVLFPGHKIVYFSTVFILGVVELPAWIGLGMYFVMQVVSTLGTLGNQGGGTAYAAHVGGLVAGLILGRLLAVGDQRGRQDRSESAPTQYTDWR